MNDLKVEIATREPRLLEAKNKIPNDTKTPQTVLSREKLENNKEILIIINNRITFTISLFLRINTLRLH